MLSNGVFEMPFCIKKSNTHVIRPVSSKTCLLVLPQEWGFKAVCT